MARLKRITTELPQDLLDDAMAVTGKDVTETLVEGLTSIRRRRFRQGAARPPLASFIGRGKGCFGSAAEVDAFLRSERDAWEP